MIGLTPGDYLLFPLYLYAIVFVFKKLRRKYEHDQLLTFYFNWGFRIKIVIIILYTLLSHFVLRGDAVDLYFGEGKHFTELIQDNPEKINLLFTKAGPIIDEAASDGEKGYLFYENNYMVVRVCVLLCFLTFSKFMCINLIIGFIAFLASWELFLFFRRLYPDLHKLLAIACMGIPTVLFWSAGISKDTLCMICIGYFTKTFFDLFDGKKLTWFKAIALVLILLLIYDIKSYIIISYLPFYLFFVLTYSIGKANNKFIKVILTVTLPVLFVVLMLFLYLNGGDLLENFSSEKLLESVNKSQDSYKYFADAGAEGSFFTLGDFDGSVGGFLRMTPKAIGATFFRPFIWESSNLIMFMSSLESTAILIFFVIAIFKNGLLTFFRRITTNGFLIYCLGFALVFGAFVGISTFNFGSLVRYKIPSMPFFVVFIIVLAYGKKDKHQVGNGQMLTGN